MKKVLAVIAVVAVVCGAGSAFAQGQQRQDFQRQFQGYGPCYYGGCRGPQGMNWQPSPFDRRQDDIRSRGRDGGRRGIDFAPDMPQEIRAKTVELAKLRIDLEEALSSKPVNKAKALEVHAQIQKLEQEIEAWSFARKLDRIEEFRTQRELNRKVPPAPKPETPAE